MLKQSLTAMILALSLAFSAPARAGTEVPAVASFTFASIDGGEIRFSDWAGQPVLVANTASLCGFSRQYSDLQDLYERYGAEGLVVLAIPSDDFRQELGSDAEVKEFCEMTFGLTMPMTVISHVTGTEAIALYQWLRETTGFRPTWNFNKVLIGADGTVLGTWGSRASPTGPEIIAAVERALGP
jgi:glutathione peroxidase